MIRSLFHILLFILCLSPLQAQQLLCFPAQDSSHSSDAAQNEYVISGSCSIRVEYAGPPSAHYLIIDRIFGESAKPDYIITLPDPDSSVIEWKCGFAGVYRVAIWDSAFQTIVEDTLNFVSATQREPLPDYSGFRLEFMEDEGATSAVRVSWDQAMNLNEAHLDIWKMESGDPKDLMSSESFNLKPEWSDADFLLPALPAGSYDALLYDRHNRLIAKTRFDLR